MARIPRKAPDGYKWCPRCSAFRQVSEFGPNAGSRDGLQHYCRVHQNAVSAESKGRARRYRLSKLSRLFRNEVT